MRRFEDLLRDLGFNPDAPIETQSAFVRHLIKAAAQVSPAPPLQPHHERELPLGTQLSFDPKIVGPSVPRKVPK